jgi:hypothetical protein
VTLSQSPAAGTLVGLGTTTITVTATDASHNSSSCATTFTVIDNTPPTINAPADINVVDNAVGSCGASIDPGTPLPPTVAVLQQSLAHGAMEDLSLTCIQLDAH